MGDNVYQHRPTDADRGLDRKTPKQGGACQRAQRDYRFATEEFRRVQARMREVEAELHQLRTGPPPHCYITTGGRRIEVPCAPRRDQIVRLEARLGELRQAYQYLLERLPRLRAAMGSACQPLVSELPADQSRAAGAAKAGASGP